MRSTALLFSLLPLVAHVFALPSPQKAAGAQNEQNTSSVNNTNGVDPSVGSKPQPPSNSTFGDAVTGPSKDPKAPKQVVSGPTGMLPKPPAPVAAPLRPGATRCDIVDDECDCILNKAGGLDMYCGYVDPKWHSVARRSPFSSGAAGPVLDKPVNNTAPSNSTKPATTVIKNGAIKAGALAILNGLIKAPTPPADFQGPSSPLVVHYAKDTAADAVRLLNVLGALDGVQGVIRNRVTEETRGKFVQGVMGTLPKDAKTNIKSLSDQGFLAGSLWEARWDFSWLRANGAPPATGVFGPHIVVRVQAPKGSKGSLALAIYPENAKRFKDIPVPGDHYFTEVLMKLNEVAGFDQANAAYKDSEASAAKLIVKEWIEHEKRAKSRGA